MKWIDVEKELPPQKVYVIVAHFDPRPNVEMSFVSTAERIGNRWFEGKDGEEITGNGKYGYVTHWMPLPDPPNKPPIYYDEISKMPSPEIMRSIKKRIKKGFIACSTPKEDNGNSKDA